MFLIFEVLLKDVSFKNHQFLVFFNDFDMIILKIKKNMKKKYFDNF